MTDWRTEGSSGSSLDRWLPPPALIAFLHVNGDGIIQHAEGNISELFGTESLQNHPLSALLKSHGDEPLRLEAWLKRNQKEPLILRSRVEVDTGEFIPVELQASYQGDEVYLVSVRSVFVEVVEQFAAHQLGVLEMLARGNPMEGTLTRIVELIEDALPGCVGSILLLDAAKNCFREGAAPKLPGEYNHAVEGLPIGPYVGSCGAALHSGRRVITRDISSDPLWADYRHLILPFGYESCWSTPFFADDGRTLGTFGIYYREKRAPQDYEIAIVDAASHLAAVVVAHHDNQRRLRDAVSALKQSEDRLQATFDLVNDGIFVHDGETGAIIEVNERTVEMYGWTKEEIKRLTVADVSAGHPPYSQKEAMVWMNRARTEGPQIFEWRARHRTGGLFWVEVNLRFARLGQQDRILVTVRDISQRKHTEERLELALRGTDLGMWDWDITTGAVVLGERWLTMLGYGPEELPHTLETWKNLIHSEDAPAVENALSTHLAGKSERYSVEFRLQTKDGGWRWVQARGRVTERSSGGEPLRMTGTHLDIHARKTAEEELQRSQRRYELVVTGSGAGLWDWNIQAGTCYFSARLHEMLGLPEPGAPGTWNEFLSLMHPEDAGHVTQALTAHLELGTPFDVECRLRTGAGEYHWFNATGQASHDERGAARQMAGSLIDIHERRSAEERLREHQRVLETLLGNLVGMAYRCRIDENWTMEFVSHGCGQLTGYQPEDLLHNRRISYEEITHPADRQKVRDAIYQAIDQGRQFEFAYRIVTAQGTVKVVWERGVGIRSPAGKLEFLEGFISDLTEIRRSQEKIAEQAALLDEAKDAIIVRDLAGIITYWNQGASRLYGWSRDEVIGKPVANLFYRDGTTHPSAIQKVLQHGEWSGELQHLTNTTREVTVESRWTLLRDEAGNPKSILTIDTDITEKKRLEAQFLRAQRMESIGTLAGGIAHDLNNVLAPIIMSIDLLRLSAKNKDDLELLHQMDSSARRGAELVKQVLSFARGVGGRRVSINPSYLIKEVIKIVKDTFPKSITIKSHRSADLWTVAGDPTQLHQVLLNLCVNARDAMPDGGTLSLLAENVELNASEAAAMENARPGSFVQLIVEDTGTGIPEELAGRIFEPFFTTKEIGKGTGLGLSTVLAIVRSHGGFIRLESELSKGSSFHVYLPTSSGPANPAQGPAMTNNARGRGECILVVDDEASLRSVLKNALETFGYEVITAENGATALSHYERERHRIKAIITDMMMPVMDGLTMITALRELGAQQPIIASSGLNESINIGRATAAGVNHFLAKPYSADIVLRALEEALGDQPPENPPEKTGPL